MQFRLVSDNQPKGDQPEAISQLVQNLNDNVKDQVLLGITGSAKLSIANLIEKVRAHARSPAQQNARGELYRNSKVFPKTRSNFFSYTLYIKPKRTLRRRILHEKEASVNDEITAALSGGLARFSSATT